MKMNLLDLVESDPERLDGEVCFRGTRVPVRNLFDYLAAGEPLAEFLEDFPGVRAEHASEVIHAADQVLEELLLARSTTGPAQRISAGHSS